MDAPSISRVNPQYDWLSLSSPGGQRCAILLLSLLVCGSHLPDPLFDPLFRFHVFNLTLSRLFVNEEMVQRNQGEWSCTSAQFGSLPQLVSLSPVRLPTELVLDRWAPSTLAPFRAPS